MVVIAIQAAELYYLPAGTSDYNEYLTRNHWNPDVQRWNQLWSEYIALGEPLHYHNTGGFRMAWVPTLVWGNGTWRSTWQHLRPILPAGNPLTTPPQFHPSFDWKVETQDVTTPTGFTSVSEALWLQWWLRITSGVPSPPVRLELAPRVHDHRVEYEAGLRAFAERYAVHGWTDSTFFATWSDARWLASAGDFLERVIAAHPELP
jgi:hypothetical protein